MSLIKALKPDPEAKWRKGGWRPRLAFRTSGFGGEPLTLTLRLPLEWMTCDFLALPAEVTAVKPKPGSLAEAMMSIATVADRSGAITVQGMVRPVELEGRPDFYLLLTMTVALAQLPGPAPQSIPDAEVRPVEFKDEGGAYRGTRIRQIRSREFLPGQPAVSFLTVQFMLETGHGWLVITFATPQADLFTQTESMFDKIAEMCRLEAR
jgi:hypothetical protein